MISKIFLAFITLSIGAIGIVYLYDPNILLVRYDLETGSPGMDNMLRATYGGLFLGSAFIFLVGILVPSRRRDALIFVAIFMGGNAIGRTASMVTVGAPPDAIMPLLFFEIVATVMAIVLAMRSSKKPG